MKTYQQHFTFTEDQEISLSESVLNEGTYVLEIRSTEEPKEYQRLELTKDELLAISELMSKINLKEPLDYSKIDFGKEALKHFKAFAPPFHKPCITKEQTSTIVLDREYLPIGTLSSDGLLEIISKPIKLADNKYEYKTKTVVGAIF